MVISLFGSGRFGLFLGVAAVESVDAAGRINQLLLAGEERMAGRADFHVQVALFSRSSLKCFAARTGDGHFLISGMNFWFHYFLVPLPIVSNRVLSPNKL